jgi:hypothetical protein
LTGTSPPVPLASRFCFLLCYYSCLYAFFITAFEAEPATYSMALRVWPKEGLSPEQVINNN